MSLNRLTTLAWHPENNDRTDPDVFDDVNVSAEWAG